VSVATMNIKDPEIRAAARRLARARGVSMTEAVRRAIDEALARSTPQRDEAWVERMLELGRQTRAEMDRLGIRPLTDDEMYDERGLPR
jgi:antitoxin VapB